MISRVIALILLLLLAPVVAHADPSLGGKAGLSFATWLRDTRLPLTSEQTYKVGLSAGGSIQLRYWDRLMPQVELLFMQRGTGAMINGAGAGFIRLNYLDLVLLSRFELPIHDCRIYALAGPELSVLLTATETSSSNVSSDVRDKANALDLGLLIGAGVAIGPFSWGTFTIEVRYDRGLRNVDKNGAEDGVTVSNQTIAFLVGYEYRRDRDRDGIADSKDRCPRQAEDRDGFEDSDGCPDADHDSAAVTRYP